MVQHLPTVFEASKTVYTVAPLMSYCSPVPSPPWKSQLIPTLYRLGVRYVVVGQLSFFSFREKYIVIILKVWYELHQNIKLRQRRMLGTHI
jgi:hypothetical protein